jgi:hypothetical protein
MSVTLRPYRGGGWEVDITIRLPDGSQYRERKRASRFSKSAARRWAEDRERYLLQHGPPTAHKEVPTLEAFAPRFVDGHARANRHKPSGINSMHLRSDRVLCLADRSPITRDRVIKAIRGAQRVAGIDQGRAHPAAHVLLAPGDEGRACTGHPGAGGTRGPVDDAALHALEKFGDILDTREAASGSTCERGI